MAGRQWGVMAMPYDLLQRALEPGVLRGTRRWVAGRATGRTLDVAIGSGLTVPLYPSAVTLTGVDTSPTMLALARRRAEAAGRPVDLRLGDAEDLRWATDSFDTVVCVFGLCAVRDHRRALDEMARVLRPGGALVLADHVVSTHRSVRAVQAVLDTVPLPLPDEHWRRRPLPLVTAMGFAIESHDRFLAGIVERLAARRRARPGALTTGER
jgi:ubiquinone/menaquinone biosynthesis C-methylase UbiE